MFWLYAVILLTAVLAVAIYSLLSPRRGGGQSREQALRALYRDRLSALDRDLRLGTLAEEQFSAMRLETEREFLRDLETVAAAVPPEQQRRSPRLLWSAYCLAGLFPALAFGLYFKLGNPDFPGHSPEPDTAQRNSLPSVEEMVAALAARLAQQPGNLADWMLLARSYMTLERYSEAAAAMEQAYSLAGEDRPEVLLQYANALGMANNGQFAGRPAELVEQALALEPDNADGLWLAGVVALESGDFSLATDRWRQLAKLLQDDPEALSRLERTITHVEQRSGSKNPAADSPAGASGAAVPPVAPRATKAAPPDSSAEIHAGALQVRVSISPSLLAATDPSDTVFVFARAPEGPPMPVAATRRQVGDLPLEVTLDDSASVMPTARLSNFRRVQVSARVSKSGNAMPQSGDLKAEPADAVPGSGPTLDLVIDRKIP